MSDNFEISNAKTDVAMKSPRVGDRFSEMFSFWVYVIGIEGDKITIIEASPPCELPKDGKISTTTLSEFRKRFSYGAIPGYWVRYVDGDNNVEGWDK